MICRISNGHICDPLPVLFYRVGFSGSADRIAVAIAIAAHVNGGVRRILVDVKNVL